MYQVRIYITALLLFIVAQPSEAQSVTVSGRVVSEQTGNPLARIPLYLMGTPHAAFTDRDGHYIFRQVREGSYELMAVFPGLGQVKNMLQVKGDEDVVHDITVPYEVDATGNVETSEAAVNDSVLPDPSATASAMDNSLQSSDVQTVCSCYTSATDLLDKAIDLRGRFTSMATYNADNAAVENMQVLLGNWNSLQRQCLSQFGTKLFEETTCNKPDEIARKRQILSNLGIRS